jgi:predicted membrane-bound mannosyltransferase
METKAVSVEHSIVRRWMSYGAGLRLESRTVSSLYLISGVLMVMAVGAVLRLWNLGSANLWTDEAWTANRVHERLAESLANIMAVHNHGPAYFMLLRVFPNSTDALLRLPSALWPGCIMTVSERYGLVSC